MFLYLRFSSEAHENWKQRAEQNGTWLSQTFITWLDENQLSVIALTTLLENSENLSEEELAGAFDSLEQRSKAFFLENALLIQRDDSDQWISKLVVNTLTPHQSEVYQGEISKVTSLAEERWGNTIIGTPFEDPNLGKVVFIALSTDHKGEETVVLGLLSLDEIYTSLKELYIPKGLFLTLDAVYPSNGEELNIYRNKPEAIALTTQNRSIDGGVDFRFIWDISDQFENGPQVQIPTILLISGLSFTNILTIIFWILLKTNTRIKNEVKKATEELSKSNRDIHEAKQKAVEASRAKSEFLANTSHEIRTPLNAIIGLNHLMKKTQLNKKQMDYVKKISSSSSILLSIVNDVLDISKIESGELHLNNVIFSLNEPVEAIRDLFQEKAEEKNIRFTVNIAKNVPEAVIGDSQRFGQILLNLCSNAIKFTHTGGVSLTLEWYEEGDLGQLIIKVRDTGIGLSDFQKQKIFSNFSQVDGSSTRVFSGAGLGLSITKKLVEMMNGHIDVYSKEGEGSEFVVSLSLEVGEIEEIESRTSTPKLNLHQRRILLVEDNLINQQVASELLKDQGADICIAENGQIAVEQAELEDFDLILMDLQMPIMGGIDAAREILKNRPHTKIVALTADAISNCEDRIKEAGMIDYVTKPIVVNHLFEVLSKHLSQEKEILEPATISEKILETPSEELRSSDNKGSTLNIDEGMKRVNHNQKLYLKLLRDFANEYDRVKDTLMNYIEDDDWDSLERSIHTLKGVSGNIGAQELYKFSQIIEREAKNRSPILEAYIEELAELLEDAKSEIYKTIPEASIQQQVGTNKIDDAPMTEFIRLLRSCDSECLDLYETWQDSIGTVLGEDKTSFEDLITEYEFEKAHDLLLTRYGRAAS